MLQQAWNLVRTKIYFFHFSIKGISPKRPFIHAFEHRRQDQPCKATASSPGAVRVRCLAQRQLNLQLEGSRDQASNLPVTGQPLVLLSYYYNYSTLALWRMRGHLFTACVRHISYHGWSTCAWFFCLVIVRFSLFFHPTPCASHFKEHWTSLSCDAKGMVEVGFMSTQTI